MGHSGGSGPGGTTVVRSMASITITESHPEQVFYGNRRPGALEAAARSAFSKSAAASASARGPTVGHMGVKNIGQGDEDGLLERLKDRRGAVL